MTAQRAQAVYRYNHSEKARAAQQRYRQSPAYQVVRFLISHKPARQLANRLYHQRRRACLLRPS